MSINAVFYCTLVCLLVIQFLVLPSLHRKIKGELGPAVIKPYVWFHLFAILRTVALALLIGTVLIVAALHSYAAGPQATSGEVASLLARLRDFRAAAVKVDIAFTLLALTGLTAGLAWITYKQAQQKAEKLFASIIEEEQERVLGDFDREEWEALPPTDEMRHIATSLEQAEAHLQRALQGGDSTGAEMLRHAQKILQTRYISADVVRRMKVQLARPLDDDLILPASSSWSDRVRHMVVNRGVLKTLSGGSRLLAFVALAALVPASVGLNLGLAGEDLARRYVALDALRVQMAGAQTRSALEAALQAPPVPRAAAAPPVPDAVLEEQIIYAYDNSFNSHVVAKVLPSALRPAFARTDVREAILRDYSATAGVEVVAGERESTEGLIFTAREKLRERLHLIREHNKDAWAALKAAFPAGSDFSAPVQRRDLKRALADQVVKAIFANSGEQLAAAYGYHGHEVFAAIITGQSPTDAMRNSFQHKAAFWTDQAESDLHAIQQRVDAGGHPVDNAMRDNPPTLYSQKLPAQTAVEAEELLRAMPEHNRAVDALAGYQDLAPGHLGGERDTMAAGVRNRLKPAARPSAVALLDTAQSEIVYKRAYSYNALHGFAKVGGVLIGRPPDNAGSATSGADISDFGWSFERENELTLTLTSSDGNKQRFGPYPQALVRQALVYAADRRPLTVTIIEAKPLPDRKIILHPSLVDTPLGCQAVQLDKLIAVATEADPYPSRAMRTAHINDALYQLSWATAVAAKLPPLDHIAAVDTEKREAVAELLQYTSVIGAEAKLKLPTTWPALKEALGDTKQSPVEAKPDFYDVHLAELASACVGSSNALKGFEKCIQAAPMRQTMKEMLHMLPELGSVSGVRELPYNIDPKLNFLRPVDGNVLWPFDFVLLTPFLKKSQLDPHPFIDESPFDFPQLHKRLLGDVLNHIIADKKSAEMMKDMRSFTVVQRLFRAALAGQLGERFPLKRLTQLSQELKKRAAPPDGYRTRSWEPAVHFEKELVAAITAEMAGGKVQHRPLAQLTEAFTRQIALCRAQDHSAGEGQLMPSAPAARERACQFVDLGQRALKVEKDPSATPREHDIASWLRLQSGVLALRSTIGVFAPENVNAKRCPAL